MAWFRPKLVAIARNADLMRDEAVQQGVEADEAKRIGASQLNSSVRQTC
jgi:hypothetical protein